MKGEIERLLKKVQDEYSAELQELFWQRVAMQSSDDCWEWQGKMSPNGYGALYHKGTRYVAHRMSWELSKGLRLGRYFACHKCDNRSCVNPNHLFPGTPMDNTRDMLAKGRQKKPKSEPGLLQVNVRLPPMMVAELDARAIGCGKSQFVRQALQREFERLANGK
jgi:HNH endonuclease